MEPSCKEIVELVTAYLEQALDPHDLLAFEEHLAGCEACRDYVDQIRETVRLTGRLRDESLTPELRDELVAAFATWRPARQG
jgi:predicted anti-sigma-YlaC factor YlaD